MILFDLAPWKEIALETSSVLIAEVVAGALLGVVAGSFIATVAVRWPTGDSALGGRSRCDGCGNVIPAHSLLPLISYARLRGRAGCCGSRIDPVHPLVEAAGGTIGGLSALLPLPFAAAGALFGWLLLTLAIIDLRSFRLPTAVVTLVAISGLGASFLMGSPALLPAIVGMGTGFCSLKTLQLAYRWTRGREGLGSGDPKLFGAIGAWVGWQPLPLVLLAAALLGLGWAILVRLSGRDITLSDRLPLGTLLAATAWPTWLWTVGRVTL